MFPLLDGAHSASYSWHWDLHPDVLLVCFALMGGYGYAVTRLRERISDAGRVKRSQMSLYFLGVLTIFVAAATPLHDLSEHYLLSAHMFQHLLFTLVAAPLFIAGTPAWLWHWLLASNTRVYRVTRLLFTPLLAFGLFNALIVLTHLPEVMDLALRYHALHFFIHAVLLFSALLMWWPVLSPLSSLPRLSEPAQMAYLFLQSLLPSVVASFVTFADRAVYGFYAGAPRLWGISAVEDQQIAGGIMKVLGSLILWSFIAIAFFRWYEREQAESHEPSWRDVQDELDEMGLTHARKRQ